MKVFLVELGFADPNASAQWWRNQLLDADYDFGNVWVKTGETRDAFRVAQLILKIAADGNFEIQQEKLDIVKAKSGGHDERIQQKVFDAMTAANAVKIERQN